MAETLLELVGSIENDDQQIPEWLWNRIKAAVRQEQELQTETNVFLYSLATGLLPRPEVTNGAAERAVDLLRKRGVKI